MTCRADPLVGISSRFTCERIAGRPTMAEADCAARWRRAQRPAAEDPHRPLSFAACAGCQDGARRNGVESAPVEVRRVGQVTTPPGQQRQEVIVRAVRAAGTASLADLVVACQSAGLDAAHTRRQTVRMVRVQVERLLAEGRIRRLARGLYGTRRAAAPVSRRAMAVAWIDAQPQPWSPAELQAAVASTLVGSTRPRQRVHKLLRRLIHEGEVQRVGLGLYVQSGLGLPDGVAPGLAVASRPKPRRRAVAPFTQMAFTFLAA